MQDSNSVVMIGATGAVGSHTAQALVKSPALKRLTTLGRRPLASLEGTIAEQHIINLFDPSAYKNLLPGHTTAICTLGIGQPSKVSRDQFIKVDKVSVLDFATECKQAGVTHFQLLSSVGVNPKSNSFYLRTKGELEDGLKELNFKRLSLFHPSMILTPTNRYGFWQGVTLKVWPLLGLLLFGPLKRYRGIRVEQLGQAIAQNTFTTGARVEVLEWEHFSGT